jgi:hypothetical protein
MTKNFRVGIVNRPVAHINKYRRVVFVDRVLPTNIYHAEMLAFCCKVKELTTKPFSIALEPLDCNEDLISNVPTRGETLVEKFSKLI